MRLSNKEFKAMNSPFRRFLQRQIELPYFKKLGLSIYGENILEIGCGSGFGAELLLELHPKSYIGIDLMPEQIALAEKRDLHNCIFRVLDATELSRINIENLDVIIIFGILHHISEWRDVIKEIYKVLKNGGLFYIEEPDLRFLKSWDKIFKWGHPAESDFSLVAFEEYTRELGFTIEKKKNIFSFGFYSLLKQ